MHPIKGAEIVEDELLPIRILRTIWKKEQEISDEGDRYRRRYQLESQEEFGKRSKRHQMKGTEIGKDERDRGKMNLFQLEF